MSYSYIHKNVYKPYRQAFDAILKEMQKQLRKKGITMTINLIGSGINNCVTKNNSTGLWDLDYNIIIQKLPEEFVKRQGHLKDKIRTIIDQIIASGNYLKGYAISFGKNSKVPITYIVKKDGQVIMGVDIAVIRNQKGTNFRLINDKPNKRYIWNEVRSRIYSDHDIKIIKDNKKALELRSIYLEKKNAYPKMSSFILFNQAVNETLQLIRVESDHNTSIQNKKEVNKVAKVSGNNHSKTQMNHYSNQKNPKNSAHRAVQNNRSNQMNPNNVRYKGENSNKSGK